MKIFRIILTVIGSLVLLYFIAILGAVYIGVKTESGTLGELHSAAYDGNNEKILKLLKEIDINKLDSQNKTPLHKAIENGHLDTVELLIDNGANLEANHTQTSTLKFTPLYEASYIGRNDMIMLLLDSGASLDKTPIAIHAAVQRGHIETVKLLISLGVDINYKDIYGATPLLQASGMYYFIPTDSSGNKIINNNYMDIIDILIENGADIFALDYGRYSTLMNAADVGSIKGVKLFYELGLQIDQKNKDGKTAIDLAKEKDEKEIVEYLSSQISNE